MQKYQKIISILHYNILLLCELLKTPESADEKLTVWGIRDMCAECNMHITEMLGFSNATIDAYFNSICDHNSSISHMLKTVVYNNTLQYNAHIILYNTIVLINSLCIVMCIKYTDECYTLLKLYSLQQMLLQCNIDSIKNPYSYYLIKISCDNIHNIITAQYKSKLHSKSSVMNTIYNSIEMIYTSVCNSDDVTNVFIFCERVMELVEYEIYERIGDV